MGSKGSKNKKKADSQKKKFPKDSKIDLGRRRRKNYRKKQKRRKDKGNRDFFSLKKSLTRFCKHDLSLFFLQKKIVYLTGSPTTNGGMQNESSAVIYIHSIHVFARLARICKLSRCFLTNVLHQSSAGSSLRAPCWLGGRILPFKKRKEKPASSSTHQVQHTHDWDSQILLTFLFPSCRKCLLPLSLSLRYLHFYFPQLISIWAGAERGRGREEGRGKNPRANKFNAAAIK